MHLRAFSEWFHYTIISDNRHFERRNTMFDKLRQSKLMFWSLELLILACLIFVSSKINFIFGPIGTFFSTLFAPVLVAGFLYYILNPIVKLLTKAKIKRIWAIAIVFVILIVALALTLGTVIPNLVRQLSSLATSLPDVFASLEAWFYKTADLPIFKQLDLVSYIKNIDISYGSIIQQFVSGLSNSLGSIVSTVTSVGIVVFTAPFILFYMLKDGERMVPAMRQFLPKKHQAEIEELLGKLDYTLSKYISGQAIECLFVGTFTFIGYWLVGVDYAFLFGVIAGLTNLIPYLGPYIGLAPAVFVTVFDSPFKALLCCIVVLVVQQLDGNIIYPNVIGKSLQIHPLTIILVLLVAGNLAGLLGIFLGVPVYAILKTIVVYAMGIFKTARQDKTMGMITTEQKE